MKVEQISIFLENKSGRLAEVTDILSRAGVNIRALSLADTADFGILRLIVNQGDLAKQVMKEHGFTVGKTEVVALEVPDRPGGLGEILKILHESGINVEYMYAFVQRPATTRSSSSASTRSTRRYRSLRLPACGCSGERRSTLCSAARRKGAACMVKRKSPERGNVLTAGSREAGKSGSGTGKAETIP